MLSVSGLYIGRPFMSMPGPAGQSFVMGWMKIIHGYTAYVFTAALVMRNKGCDNASTIHSLIYRAKESGVEQPSFELWDDAPASKAKLIVIDECSMVDAELGRDLMSFGVPVLVLGDPAPLPRVPGFQLPPPLPRAREEARAVGEHRPRPIADGQIGLVQQRGGAEIRRPVLLRELPLREREADPRRDVPDRLEALRHLRVVLVNQQPLRIAGDVERLDDRLDAVALHHRDRAVDQAQARQLGRLLLRPRLRRPAAGLEQQLRDVLQVPPPARVPR